MTKPIRHSGTQPVFLRSQLEITIAVKDKNGEWKTPDLKEEAQKSIQNAIETVKQIGLRQGTAAFNKFVEEGAVLEVSSSGVRIQERDTKKWRNLLDDQTVTLETKQAVHNTLKGVRSVLGHLKATEARAADWVTEAAESSEDLIIGVRVVPKAERYAEFFQAQIDQEENFKRELERLITDFQKPEIVETLEFAAGFDPEEISQIKQRLQKLSELSETLSHEMQHVHDLLKKGDVREAANDYAQHIPAAYQLFCDAFRECAIDQKRLEEMCGSDHSFKFNLEQVHFQISVAKQFYSFVTQIDPEIDGEIIQKKMANSLQLSYSNFFQLLDSIQGLIAKGLKEERDYNRNIQMTQDYIQREGSDALKTLGFKRNERQKYQAQLTKLKLCSDKMLLLLEITQERLRRGEIQKALDPFFNQIEPLFADYVQASIDTIDCHNLARGHAFNQSAVLPHFSWNLDQPNQHHILLREISRQTEQLEVIDAKEDHVINNKPFSNTLDKTDNAKKRLSEINKLRLATAFRIEHENQLKYTRELGEFINQYREKRELFDQIMRKHGISDLDSALVYNHLDQTYDALVEWNQYFQKVVDLINQNQYAEALEYYGRFALSLYPKFMSQVENFIFIGDQRDHPDLQNALQEFLQHVGLNPAQTAAPLRTERVPSKPHMILTTIIEMSKKANLEIPQVLQDASDFMQQKLMSLNQRRGDYDQLFKKDFPLAGFLNLSSSSTDPYTQEWKKLLHEHGWNGVVVSELLSINNRYITLLKTLSNAEHAVNAEVNVQKKRALRSQFKRLARKLRPELIAIEEQLSELGGMQQLETLRKMVESIGKQVGIENARKELNSLFEQHPEKYHAVDYQSVDDLVHHLEEDLKSKKLLKSDFSRELKLIRKIKLFDKLKSQSSKIIGSLQVKREMVQNIYDELNVTQTWNFGSIKGLLLNSPFSSDPQFLAVLKQRGWNQEKITKLNNWYDSYMRHAFPLINAKKALDEDPENPLLQRNLQHIIIVRMVKLRALMDDFYTNFGLEEISHLEKALNVYQTQSENLTQDSVELLKLFKLNDAIRQTARLIGGALSPHINTWDTNFLNDLASPKSPLSTFKPATFGNQPLQGPLWNQILSQYQLNLADVTRIAKLFGAYQNSLRQIAILERELEINPSSEKTRKELLDEMQFQRKSLNQLDTMYSQLSQNNKIHQLGQAIEHYKTYVGSLVGTLENFEQRILQTSGQPELQGLYIAERDRILLSVAGGLSLQELRQIHRKIANLNVRKTFEEKRSFEQEVYSRLSFYTQTT